MEGLIEHIQLDQATKDKFIKEVIDELGHRLVERMQNLNEDVAKGIVPLLQKYVWNVMGVDPDKLQKRELAIRAYYKSVYDTSKGNVGLAYDKTDEWAKEIFRT